MKGIFPSTAALSIFPVGNGNCYNGNDTNGKAPIYEDEDSDDEEGLVMPKVAVDIIESYMQNQQPQGQPKNNVAYDEHQSLLGRLDRRELTIIERQGSSGDRRQGHGAIQSNGNGSSIPSPPSRETDSCSETEDMEPSPEFCDPFKKPANGIALDEGLLIDRPNGEMPLPQKTGSVRRRRSRKFISQDDPTESLTEMSVRGLNLFRYATVNAGLYECLECSKEGAHKTFKNKYSFQRHAFLYHEGQQRKVFPCPVCCKEFSRPDKMKNHRRASHGGGAAAVCEGKSDPATSTQGVGFHSSQNIDLVHFQLHLQQQHHLHQQQQQHYQQHNQSARDQQKQQVLEKRHLQEQDVQKIHHAVNAITLRQLQQIRFHQQHKEAQLEHHQLLPSPQLGGLSQRTISNPTLDSSLPSQKLFVLSAIGSE